MKDTKTTKTMKKQKPVEQLTIRAYSKILGIKPPKDATENYTVNLKQAFIRCGEGGGHSRFCPYALAIKSQANVRDVRVFGTAVYILFFGEDHFKRYIPPKLMVQQVRKADNKDGKTKADMIAGIYELRAPTPSQTMGARGRKTGNGPRPGKSKSFKGNHIFINGKRARKGKHSARYAKQRRSIPNYDSRRRTSA